MSFIWKPLEDVVRDEPLRCFVPILHDYRKRRSHLDFENVIRFDRNVAVLETAAVVNHLLSDGLCWSSNRLRLAFNRISAESIDEQEELGWETDSVKW